MSCQQNANINIYRMVHKEEGAALPQPRYGKIREGFVAPKKNLSRTFLDCLPIL
jgi:hypothetical protein